VIDVEGYGIIKFELYDNMTPITTQNFVDLASTGFYNGIKFHRCIDDFVAQTGDPNTKNNNPYDDGSGGSGNTIPLEICRNASHVDGAVGMARSNEPDSASSQFYICDGPQHGLDDWERDGHGYAVFGVVIEGLDIAKRIAACDTYGNRRPLLRDHPVDDITMTRVTIEDGVWENETGEDDSKEKGSSGRDIPATGFFGAIISIAVIAIFIDRRRV
jgi:peptidyl-prolyl cis-trans isomerase B (cyclophilin B)